MLKYHVLASGSSGNMTLIQSSCANLLIDCGLTLKRTLQKLSSCGIDIASVDAILLTHSHSDHSKGCFALSQFTRIYLTRPLFDLMVGEPYMYEKNYIFFRSGEAFWIKDIRIFPVPVSHDCVDPVCFIFSSNGEKMAIMTDLGCVDDRLIAEVYGCQRILIEANYDLSLLVKSQRPAFLKNRLLGRKGHLSNKDTGRFLCAVCTDRLEEIVLLHLSRECNAPSLALAEIKKEILKKHSLLPSFQVAGVEGLSSLLTWL